MDEADMLRTMADLMRTDQADLLDAPPVLLAVLDRLCDTYTSNGVFCTAPETRRHCDMFADWLESLASHDAAQGRVDSFPCIFRTRFPDVFRTAP